MAEAIIYRQTATLTVGNTYVDVTLDHSFSDTSYTIAVEIPYQTSWWITNKTSTAFRFNVGTINAYNQTINFIIYHE